MTANALPSALRFSRASFVGSEMIAYLVGKSGSRSVYFGGSMICLDNEFRFRSSAIKDNWPSAMALLYAPHSTAGEPRWCAYDIPVYGRSGRLAGFVSIMSPLVTDGGSLVQTAALMKEIKAEVAACDLTAAELVDLYSLDARGYLVTVRDASGNQL
jgi:hypothetical protein